MPKVETGRLQLSWEHFKAIGLDGKYNACRGCEEKFFVGEFVGLMRLSGEMLYFHEGCLNQVVMILMTFLESTADVRENVSTRKN